MHSPRFTVESDPPHQLPRKGDLVRVTPQNRMSRYKPGDRGLVADGPHALGGEGCYYLVMMCKDDPPRLVIFCADEIESEEAATTAQTLPSPLLFP